MSKVIYEPHPVSKKRKAALVSKGYRIIDAKFDPNKKEVKKVDANAEEEAAKAKAESDAKAPKP